MFAYMKTVACIALIIQNKALLRHVMPPSTPPPAKHMGACAERALFHTAFEAVVATFSNKVIPKTGYTPDF